MKKTFLSAAMAAFVAFSAGSVFTACCDDDPDYNNITPPVIAQVHNISGSIAGLDGKGISGATVNLGGKATATAQTDANGYFIFSNVAPGDYTLEASAPGKISKNTTVTVLDQNAQNVVWNVMLASEAAVTTIPVTPGTSAEDDVTTEALEGNNKAEVPVEVEVPAGAVNRNVSITVAPIYDESEAESKASTTESTMLVGVKLSCSDPNMTLSVPLNLTFVVDAETAGVVTCKKFTNGDWETVTPLSTANGLIVIPANEFTSYGVFLDVTFASQTKNEPITFAQDLWDNLYGANPMPVTEATYNYNVGTKITSTGTTVLKALLIEALARHYGANYYSTTGTYPINVTLPVGTALKIAATQAVSQVSASAKENKAEGVQYGTVTVTATPYNRNHTGSSGSGH